MNRQSTIFNFIFYRYVIIYGSQRSRTKVNTQHSRSGSSTRININHIFNRHIFTERIGHFKDVLHICVINNYIPIFTTIHFNSISKIYFGSLRANKMFSANSYVLYIVVSFSSLRTNETNMRCAFIQLKIRGFLPIRQCRRHFRSRNIYPIISNLLLSLYGT